MEKKVIIGLSGGVDSSVAALLLKQAGFTVEAVFMKNWEADDNDTHCSAEIDLADARAVAQKLQIPFHTVNFAKAYWDNVFAHFLDEYRKGRTPNPDILCNKEIKFKAFYQHALALGADFIATGHYARTKLNGQSTQLLKGVDPNKDQSYFLHAINQQALAQTIFPIGEFTKTEIRAMAQKAGLVTYKKKDSTGICFIGERNFKHFLKEYLLSQPGPIKTTDNLTVGTHDGLMYYTLGQRQGLNIGGIKGSAELPWYVIEKDIPNNTLIIGQGANHPRLLANGLLCSTPSWLSGTAPAYPLACQIKTRYRQQDVPAIVTPLSEHELCVMFSSPIRAVTPGQSVVFYDKKVCLGGAIIDEAIH